MVEFIDPGNIPKHVFQIGTGTQDHQSTVVEDPLKNTALLISKVLNIKHWNRFSFAFEKNAVANIDDPEVRNQDDF